MTTLNIKGQNLNNNTIVEYNLKGSNIFTIVSDYLAIIKDTHVEDWTLETPTTHSGNEGINSGAYLNETIEELTGFDLRF